MLPTFLAERGVSQLSDRNPQAAHFESLVVKPKIAWKMLGCGNTRGYELIAAGELESYKEGRSRKITVESIRRYIARRLAISMSEEPRK